MKLRTLMSTIASRMDLLRKAGYTFNGKRNVYEALGYKPILTPEDYWLRFRRNSIAGAVVEALPKATWRGGGSIIEDPNPEVETQFEQEWKLLNQRLKVWPTLCRADILAGLGTFSVIIIGAPGALDTELTSARADEIKFLTVRAQPDVTIGDLNYDQTSESYGLPLWYNVNRLEKNRTVRVHPSRVLHISDDILDDPLAGLPRLERIWNELDNLEKVAGGGSEAFWKRADQGVQVDIDKEIELGEEEEDALEQEIADYEHGLRRVLRTQGTKIQSIGSDVANFAGPVDAVLSLISAGTRIPKRILLGSERGELGSSQDKNNWDERVDTRRTEWAGPYVVREFIDRMIRIGVLPEAEYTVEWPQIQNLDVRRRTEVAEKLSRMNKTQGRIVIRANEIREVLGYPPLTEADYEDEIKLAKKMQQMVVQQNPSQNEPNRDPNINSGKDPNFEREEDGV